MLIWKAAPILPCWKTPAIGPAPGALQDRLHEIDTLFASGQLREVVEALQGAHTPFAADTLNRMSRNAPLSMACTFEILNRLRQDTPTIRRALELEYRWTHRAMEHGDLLEGIRAAIIDKDRNPGWRHALDAVPQSDTDAMLPPLTGTKLDFHEEVQP